MVQINTFLKLGSLAFNVAQDEKVRELATIIHQGAKRRGLFAPNPMTYSQLQKPAAATQVQQPIPFAPQPAKPMLPAPSGGIDFNKYLTKDNAKKLLGWAGTVSNLLVK